MLFTTPFPNALAYMPASFPRLRDRPGPRSVSRRPAGALAGIAMTLLLLAVPGGAVAKRPNPGLSLEVPRPAVPMRDVVLGEPGAAAARISASASSQRYSINDGSGATIAVSVTEACLESCDVTDPQRVANFVGTLIHGDEVDLLTVQLDTEYQLGFDCGFGAEACYYSGENKIVIGGYEEADGDGATFDFVLAHEYGHHVAQHREMPAPFESAIDWGPERWASLEDVCRGSGTGASTRATRAPIISRTRARPSPRPLPTTASRTCRSPGATARPYGRMPPPTGRSAKTRLRPGRGGPASRCPGAFRPGGRAQPSSPCVRRSTDWSACAQAACTGTATNWPFVAVPAGFYAAPATASIPPASSTTPSAANTASTSSSARPVATADLSACESSGPESGQGVPWKFQVCSNDTPAALSLREPT